MSPKGPVAPAPTASERRKNRRFGLILLGTIVVALIPVLLVVTGFYPKPGAESPATSSAVTDSSVSSSVVAIEDTAHALPEVKPAQPAKPAEPWWRKAWNTMRKLVSRKRPETDMAPPLPAPSAAADSVKPDSLLEQAVQGAVDMAASPFGDSLPPQDSAKSDSAAVPAASANSKSPAASVSPASPAAKKTPPSPPVIVAGGPAEPAGRKKADNLDRDSLLIRDFRVYLRDKGYSVRGDLMLYSLDRGISGRYPAFAPAIQVAIENIFYITPTENLRIPRLEALLAQQVAFVFPQGAVNRVELRNLHTEWENR